MNYNVDQEFKNEVKAGLDKDIKKISSKFLYDNEGSNLFVKITKLDEYYLTDCEREILSTKSPEIVETIGKGIDEVIELGSGDGHKTQILLNEILKTDQPTYIPVDISKDANENIKNRFLKELPQLKLDPYTGDYFSFLESADLNQHKKRLILFLGSNIGNFGPTDAVSFLKRIGKSLNKEDYLFIGMDLKKDIQVMQAAYNDEQGVTSAFNYNLLSRMNKELDANFDLNNFYHHGTYNAERGAMESYLVSLKEQKVKIRQLEMEVDFDTLEPIHVEYSYKFSYRDIQWIAKEAGFKVVKNFSDSKKYFVDSLWQKA